MTIQDGASRNVTPGCAVRLIIEISKKQWATQSAAQAAMAKAPTRPKWGTAKQARDDENDYALHTEGAWRGNVTDLSADNTNGL